MLYFRSGLKALINNSAFSKINEKDPKIVRIRFKSRAINDNIYSKKERIAAIKLIIPPNKTNHGTILVKNDAIFLRAVAEHLLKISEKIYFMRHQLMFKKLQPKIANPKERRFLDGKLVVFGDNGKENLMKKLLPRLFFDRVTKDRVKIFVLIDQNSGSKEQLLSKVAEHIESKVKKLANFRRESNNLIIAESKNDPKGYFGLSYRFVYLTGTYQSFSPAFALSLALAHINEFNPPTNKTYFIPHFSIASLINNFISSAESLPLY